MKKIIFSFALLASVSTFAQSGSLSTGPTKASKSSLSGFYIGVDYMKLSKQQIEGTYSKGAETTKETHTVDMDLGTAGVTLGYNSTPERGFGFTAGVRLLENLDKKQSDGQSIYMLIPEGNITFATTKYFFVYAGLNAGFLAGTSNMDRHKTQLGGQAGLGVRFTPNIALNAGLTALRQKYIKNEDLVSNGDVDIQLRGFSSSLVYVF